MNRTLPQKQINIFSYLQYRSFLKDWVSREREENPKFSFRSFAMKARLTSPGFLKMVMDGQRNLSVESALKFASALRLNKEETEFFQELVLFNQSIGHEEQNDHYRKILAFKKFSNLKTIEKSQYEFISTWYHPVIREMVAMKEFDGKPEWLAKRIFPPLSSKQVKESLDLLVSLGFLKKDVEGKYQQADSMISTGTMVPGLAIVNYHKEVLDLTKKMLLHSRHDRKEIRSMILGVRKGRLTQLIEKIRLFRNDILKMVSQDEEVEDLVQINFQVFSLLKETRHEK